MIIGVDLGATNIVAGLVDAEHVVVRSARAATPARHGPDAVLGRVAALVARLAVDGVEALGVGACGLVDEHGVVMETTATMPGWRGVDLAAELAARTGLPCAADNDGNAAALGEAIAGAGRGSRAVATLTLGTGVGGGLVVDGEIFHGAGAMAATFGHLKVRRGGRRCACGSRGCLEAYASAWAARQSLGIDARAAFAAARSGDDAARRFVDEAARALGVAFADIAHSINPDVIVLTGGVSEGWARLSPLALETYRRHALTRAFATTRVVRGDLPRRAGVVGAAALARRRGGGRQGATASSATSQRQLRGNR